MAETSIEWTDATWNPTTGCTKISPGCAHCYIETTPPFRMEGRKFVKGHIPLRLHADRLDKPLHWRKPRRVFVNSLSDLFHDDVPDEFIDRVFAVMALCPQHTFQILTKRAERMYRYVSARDGVMNLHWLCGPGISTHQDVEDWCKANGVTRKERERRRSIGSYYPGEENGGSGQNARPPWPLPNVWLGVSAEDQQRLDERLPWLLKTPAAVRFISAEPLLSAIDFRPLIGPHCKCDCSSMPTPCDEYCETGRCSRTPPRIQWIIVGGESGTKARPMHPDWARLIRDQCYAAGVKFFFKQWGEWAPYSLGDDPGRCETRWLAIDGKPRTVGPMETSDALLWRPGKKEAGRLLDEMEWSEFPASQFPQPCGGGA